MGHHGTWKLIANLNAFQAAHPVAHPDPGDFDSGRDVVSMIAIDGALYPMDSNHGELDRVTRGGAISRVIDISASQGHVVPTALVHHHGAIYIANLGVFDPSDKAGDEHVCGSPATGRSRSARQESRRCSGLPSAAASCTRSR